MIHYPLGFNARAEWELNKKQDEKLHARIETRRSDHRPTCEMVVI